MKNTAIPILLAMALLTACRKNTQAPEKQPATSTDTLSLQQARDWYNGQQTRHLQTQSVNQQSTKMPDIDFSKTEKIRRERGNWWTAAVSGQPTYHHIKQGYRKIVFYRDSLQQIHAHLLEIIPDAIYFQQVQKATTATFTGRIFIYDLAGDLLKGIVYLRGKAIGRIKPRLIAIQTGPQKTDAITIVETCQWYDDNYVDSDNNAVIYSEYDCTTTITDDGAGDVGGGSGAVTGGDYLGSGGTGGNASPPLTSNLPNSDDPKINPRKYMDCFGSIPDAGSKTTITVYVQEPWPGTSFNVGPNSVGHVAIGLTKTNGSTTITQVVGYYPDASGVAKFSAPSKILDNGGDLDYNVSITYTVLPSEFNNIVSYIANPPATYNLLTFNCTNFVYTACQKGDITLPDPYSPVALDAAEVMTPAALGSKIEDLKGEPNVNINGGTTPNSHGACN